MGCRLPAVVAALNGEVTRLIGKRPSEAIRRKRLVPARQPLPGDQLGLKSRSSLQGLAFVICTSLVSWRVVVAGLLTPRGL